MTLKETQLEQSITLLRTRLLVMCASVSIAIDDACESLVSGNKKKACAVIDGDDVINSQEVDIDEMALTILVRNQPVAQDLRFVVAALRMVIDLERIGDEAVNIAERAVELHDSLPRPVLSALNSFLEITKNTYKHVVEAFRFMDGDLALTLCRNKNEAIQEEVKALHQIMEYFCCETHGGNEDSSYAGMHGIIICRSLNRIYHRSKNIAEHTYFIVEGVNMKHALVKAI